MTRNHQFPNYLDGLTTVPILDILKRLKCECLTLRKIDALKEGMNADKPVYDIVLLCS